MPGIRLSHSEQSWQIRDANRGLYRPPVDSERRLPERREYASISLRSCTGNLRRRTIWRMILRVVTLRFRFVIGVADIVGDALLLFFQTLDALDGKGAVVRRIRWLRSFYTPLGLRMIA